MKIKNRYIKIFIFALSTLVFFLPQLSTIYYVLFIDAYDLTNAQAGTLLSVYGATSVPAYLFGGLLADKFSAKRLIITSCFVTGALGIAMTFVSAYFVLLAIYFLFGFTTTFLQWSAICKIVRSLGNEQEQGRLFGVMEMSYAIIGVVCLYGILAVLGSLLDTVGFKAITSIFGILLIISGVLMIILCDDPSAGIKDSDFDFKSVRKVLKHPVVWFNAFIIMGVYILNSASTYFSPYLSEVVGVSMSLAIGIQIASSYILSMIFAPVGGVVIDKSGGTTPLLFMSCGACIAFLLGIIILGPSAAVWLIVGIILAYYIVLNMMKPCVYTPIPEGGVPIELTGTAIGIASAIGYSSDIWLYTLCGSWLDKYGDAGYSRIWGLAIGGMIITAAAGVLFHIYKKSHKELIEQVYKENEMLGK